MCIQRFVLGAFIYWIRVQIDVDAITARHLISNMNSAIEELRKLANEWVSIGSIPKVDWSRMRFLDIQEILRSRDELVGRQADKRCLSCTSFDQHVSPFPLCARYILQIIAQYSAVHGEQTLRAKIANLKHEISDQNLELIPDYEQRIEVLKELKYIDENSTVLLKGRVACEVRAGLALIEIEAHKEPQINSASELILTELILENTFATYQPEEVVALLSCFVFQEKTDVEPVLPPKLEEGRDAILSISEWVGRVQDLHKVNAPEFQSTLKFGLIEVVYEWAKGMVRILFAFFVKVHLQTLSSLSSKSPI